MQKRDFSFKNWSLRVAGVVASSAHPFHGVNLNGVTENKGKGSKDHRLNRRLGSYLIFIMGVSLYACASKTLVVDSLPSAAEIQVIFPSGESKLLGVGPTSFNITEFERYPFVFLSAKKDGKQSDLIFLPREFYDRVGELQIPVRNFSQAITASGKSNLEINDSFLSQVIQAQSYIHKKNYDEAQSILVNLTGQFPQSASLWSLLGSSYYLSKKKAKALEAYEKALSLNPQATDIQRLVEQLRKE